MDTKDPLQTVTKVLTGKWKPLLLWNLHISVHRFSDLKRCVPDASPKMITQQLRELEADGLINRKIYPEIPPKVEYSLTKYVKTAMPVLKEFAIWGGNHLKRAKKPTDTSEDDFKCVCLLESDTVQSA